MPFDPRFMIDVIYPAATSSYLMTTVHAPPLPAGYTLVGAIEADPRAATTVAALTDARLHEIAAGMLSESKVFGLVAWNEAAKTALVAFRGTQSIWDWINDLDAIAIAYMAVAGSGHVHMGFQLVYEHVRQSVAKLLATCKGVQRILVTGHSLGAAVAILSGFELAKTTGIATELSHWPARERARRTFRAPTAGSFPSAIAWSTSWMWCPRSPSPRSTSTRARRCWFMAGSSRSKWHTRIA